MYPIQHATSCAASFRVWLPAWGSPPSLFASQSHAKSAHIDQRQAECDGEYHDGERRAVSKSEILQQRVEGVECHRLRGRSRTSSRKDVDQIEDAESIESSENQRHQNRRFEQRKRDVAQLPPRVRSVDGRSFVQAEIDVLQPR